MAKIYIIEDDPKIRTELSPLLTKYGYECRASDSFEGVVDAVLDDGAQLLLLDINLPVLDGYHICREIRSAPTCPSLWSPAGTAMWTS